MQSKKGTTITSTRTNIHSIPNEVWLQVFRMLNSKSSVVTCALVCKAWCYMIRDEFVTNEAAKTIFDPCLPTTLRYLRMDREWLSECLTFICSSRRRYYIVEELGNKILQRVVCIKQYYVNMYTQRKYI